MSRSSSRPGIGTLFVKDMQSLFKNVMSIIITLGLIAMPPLFAWYNTLACWNVFDNTGNLKVAVASADAGYKSDLFPVEVNIGEQVLSALRANDEIGWVITSEDDAIDGAKAGRYYAAVIIPESFSEDMLTFYSDNAQHADIVYYVNEKASAVAPKITDQGASGVSATINSVFTETLSEVSIALAESINDYVQSDESQNALARLSQTIDGAAAGIDQAADVIDLYVLLAGSGHDLAQSSSELVDKARASASDVTSTAGDSMATAADEAQTLQSAIDSLSGAFASSGASLEEVANDLDGLSSSTSATTEDLIADLRGQAGSIDQQKTQYQAVYDTLTQLRDVADASQQASIDSVLARLSTVIVALDAAEQGLNNTADSLESGTADLATQAASLKEQVGAAKQDVDGLKSEFDTSLKPGLEQIAADALTLSDDVASISGSLSTVQDDLGESADSITSALGDAQSALTSASGKLRSQASSLRGLRDRINVAVASGDSEQIQDLLNSDIDVLAAALSTPVGISRTAINPSEGFGSGMSSLYSSLAIFIGSLLIVVAIKPSPHDKRGWRKDRTDPGSTRRFLARLGAVSVVSLCQTTLLGLGNILFLDIQALHPFLYLLVCWLAGLVDTAILFSLVVAFANLGKAVGVILLIMQVTGCGGSFPLEVLPHFVQQISVLLPAYHVVYAMRAAMQGIYQYDFLVHCVALLLFFIPALLIGLVFREPFGRLTQWYVRKVEASKLIE